MNVVEDMRQQMADFTATCARASDACARFAAAYRQSAGWPPEEDA